MSDINIVTLMGRVTRNAETRISKDGLTIVSFSIAVNRNKKRNGVWENTVSFIRLALFGSRAEKLYPYLVQGRLVGIEGHLESKVVEKDGYKQTLLTVVPRMVTLYGSTSTTRDTKEEKPLEVVNMDELPELPDTQDFFSDENAVELSDIF